MTHEESTPAQLHEQIEATRAELGQTVHDLAAKTDVPARAQDKVQSAGHALRDKTAATTADAQEAATGILHQVQDKVPEPVRRSAAAAKTYVADAAGSLTQTVQDKTPPAVRAKTERAVTTVGRRLPEILIAAATGAVALGAGMMLRRSGRSRGRS